MKKVVPPACTLASVMVRDCPGELSGTVSTFGVPGMSTLQRLPSGLTAVQPCALAVPAISRMSTSMGPIHCTKRSMSISSKSLGDGHEHATRAVAGEGAACRLDASVGIGHHHVQSIERDDQCHLPVPVVGARDAVGGEAVDREVADRAEGLEGDVLVQAQEGQRHR